MNLRSLTFSLLVFCFPNLLHAAVTITIQQSGSDVTATATGSLDTTGLTASTTGTAALPIISYVSPSSYAYLVGTGGGAVSDLYLVAFTTSQPLNSVATDGLGDATSGGIVGVQDGGITVPTGYVSGASINATTTWTGQSLASLNLTPGSFLFDYGLDTITFNVIDPSGGGGGPVTTAVPVMPFGVLGLMVISLLGLGVTRIRRL